MAVKFASVPSMTSDGTLTAAALSPTDAAVSGAPATKVHGPAQVGGGRWGGGHGNSFAATRPVSQPSNTIFSSLPTAGTENSNWSPYVADVPLVVLVTLDSDFTAPSAFTDAPRSNRFHHEILLQSTRRRSPRIRSWPARSDLGGARMFVYSICALAGSLAFRRFGTRARSASAAGRPPGRTVDVLALIARAEDVAEGQGQFAWFHAQQRH